MSSTWQWILTFSSNYTWVVHVFFIVLITVVITFVERIVYARLIQFFSKTYRIWDDTLLQSVHRPLNFLIWLLGLTYAADITRLAGKATSLLSVIGSVRKIGIILFIFWFIMRFIKQVASRLVLPEYRKEPMDRTTVDATSKLLVLAVGITAGLVILQELGIPISGVLAFGGGGAIILGFAAKDLLANFFGGFMIYMDRPFSVGDWICSPDKEIEGTVEHIGWRLTRIRTFDKRPLYVPNSIFSTVAIENPSRMSNRRIKTTFGLRYCDAPKVAAITSDIEKMLAEHPEIDQRQTTFVKLIKFADSSLNILVYTFTKTTKWVKFQAIQEDVFLKIIDIVYNQHQASMAFPVRTLDASDELLKTLKSHH